MASARVVVAAAALAAQAGSTGYDGYKLCYPQLHQFRDYKSSYPQLHQVPSGAVRTPALVEAGRSGVDWRDAGLGALVGAFAVGLLGPVALRLRRSGLPALR